MYEVLALIAIENEFEIVLITIWEKEADDLGKVGFTLTPPYW